MQPPLSTLIFTDIDQITELHKNLKTLNRDCPGYGGEIVIRSLDQNEILMLHSEAFGRLVKVLVKLRCTTLRIMRTTMDFAVDIRVNVLRHLRNVELTLCRGGLIFVLIW